MNSYFRPCELCSKTQPLNELLFDGKGFITCKDSEACLMRVGNLDLALFAFYEEELAAIEVKRTELITKRQELFERLGLPDTALEHHKAELARIEAEQ
jgi:hypothetical protein